MNSLIMFPVICVFCCEQKQNYQPILNEIYPDDPQEYVCLDCIEMIEKMKAYDQFLQKEKETLLKRKELKILE